MNPWWSERPGKALPEYKRAAYKQLLRRLQAGLAPAVMLRGPRQVGKTTLQGQIIEDLLRQGVPARNIFRIQFDELSALRNLADPLLVLTRWYQQHILNQSFNEAAREGQGAYVFLDEVQNLNNWAPQIKSLVDASDVKLLVTGSSALRMEMGKDSLAGRLTTLDLGPFLLREVAGLRLGEDIPAMLEGNGIEPLLQADFWRNLRDFGEKRSVLRDKAFQMFSDRGGYPVAHTKPDVAWPDVADQLNETIVRRVIQHDLRLGQRGKKRDQQLLEEVFRLACRYCGQAPGQSVYVQELRRALGANLGWQRVLTYLKFLDGSLLVKLIQPLELRLKKKKGNLKLALCDHGIRASWLQEKIPLAPEELERSTHLADLAGHLAESVVGYFLTGISGLDVAHFPERPPEPEVDFILTIGEHRIPLEVKYRRIIDAHRDTLGLRAFLEKTVYNAPFGLLVTLRDGVEVRDPRIVALPLSSLLLMR
jgi:predicted AAA+ superfamily ATPase